MTVNHKPLESKGGFKSPGFYVDETGNFSIANLNATSAIKINGSIVINTTALGSTVVGSNLTSVGTLTGLTVNSSTDIDLTTALAFNLNATQDITLSSANLSITTTGNVVINPGTMGSIDNVDIGVNTPGDGNFINITASNDIYVGNQNIKALSAALAVALS